VPTAIPGHPPVSPDISTTQQPIKAVISVSKTFQLDVKTDIRITEKERVLTEISSTSSSWYFLPTSPNISTTRWPIKAVFSASKTSQLGVKINIRTTGNEQVLTEISANCYPRSSPASPNISTTRRPIKAVFSTSKTSQLDVKIYIRIMENEQVLT